MQFYTDLLSGDKTVQDLTDAELASVQGMWLDNKGKAHPPIDTWIEIGKETRAREVARASKPKPIIKDFFKG